MENDIGQLLKQYIKDAMREYFRELWEEWGGPEPPFPYWPPPHPKYFREYDRVAGSLRESASSLADSVQFLKTQSWSQSCSEKKNISAIKTELEKLSNILSAQQKLLEKLSTRGAP